MILHKSLEEVRSFPARDVEEWKAFFDYEPMFEPYATHAQLMHLLYSANRDKGSPKLKAEDFLPPHRKSARRRQTDEEIRAVIRGATEHLRGE